MEAIVKTDFNFPGQTAPYVGKARDGGFRPHLCI